MTRAISRWSRSAAPSAERPDAGDLDRGVGVGADHLEPLVHEVGAVRRPDAERVAGLVGQGRAGRVDDELADLLAAPFPRQQPVAGQAGQQRGRPRRHLAVAAGLERLPDADAVPLRLGRSAQRRDDLVEPAASGRAEVGVAVDPGQQPRRAELGEPLVEAPAVPAEVGVARVAEREDGVAHVRRAPARRRRPAARQNAAPLSGGSPEPYVLVTTSTSVAPARASRRASLIASSRAAMPDDARWATTDVASSSALPVCDAHTTVSVRPAVAAHRPVPARRRTCRPAARRPTSAPPATPARSAGGRAGASARRWSRRRLEGREEPADVEALVLGQRRRSHAEQVRQRAGGDGRPRTPHRARRRRRRDLRQRHRADLQLGLERHRVDGVVGDGVDAGVLAVTVVPVDRGEQVAGLHPVGDHRRAARRGHAARRPRRGRRR